MVLGVSMIGARVEASVLILILMDWWMKLESWGGCLENTFHIGAPMTSLQWAFLLVFRFDKYYF